MKIRVKPKIAVGIIGVILTVAGWFISNANSLPYVYRLVAPRYVKAQAAHVKLHGDEKVLTKGDRGFDEICEVIKEDLRVDEDPVITRIRTLNWGQTMVNTPQGMEPKKFLEAEISFTGTDPITVQIRDIEATIKRRYLDPRIFSVAAVVFWIGVGISISALCMPDAANKSLEPTR